MVGEVAIFDWRPAVSQIPIKGAVMTFMSNFRDSNESSPFQPHECLGIVGYHGQAFVRAHLTNVNNDRLHERIADLPNRIGHGNDLAAGLKLSIELLARKDRRFFRKIWLLTDGNTESKPAELLKFCLLYTSPSPRDRTRSRMPSSA